MEQAEGVLPLGCFFGGIPLLGSLFEGPHPLGCLYEGAPPLGFLFVRYYCSSPCVLLLAPRRKQLPASPTLSFLTSSPCFLPCFPSCCRLQSTTPFSVTSSLCFLNAGSPYSSRAHPCCLKIQILQVKGQLQEQLYSQVPSCAAAKCPSATADFP